MPAVAVPATILVTGGSGFIGAWVVRHLLERGFSVLAAIRTEEGGQAFLKLFPDYVGKLTYVVVPDIVKDGAYDEAVKGVEGVVHVASPIYFALGDPQEIIGPAVAGTVGILKSAQEHGSKVKRIVITSSGLAITGSEESGDRLYDENDWNDAVVDTVKKLGSSANPGDKYAASKVLAERAAWEYVRAKKPSYDLVTVLPSLTVGPFVHDVPSVDKLGSSLKLFYSFLQPGKTPDELTKPISGVVDVRDAADLHVLALTREKAGGERINCTEGSVSIQDIYDALRAAGITSFPEGEPGTGKQNKKRSNEKALRLFPDFKFRGSAGAAVDYVKQLQEKGWIN